MKLLVDMFACQTGSRFRGIGRYTRSLVREMIKVRNSNELIILASSLYPDTFEELRREFSHLLPPGSFLPYSHQPINPNEVDRDPFFEISSTIVRHAYQMVSPDAILYPSVFEGWGERGVVPLPHNGFPTSLCVAIVYDFIPYRFSSQFFDHDPFFKEGYMRRLNGYKQFDLLLAISESTRQDAIEILNFDPNRVVNLSGAADSFFLKKEYPQDQKSALFSRLNITKSYIFYTGNVEYHKNLERMLHAFMKLSPEIRGKHQIVFTHAGDEARFRAKLKTLGLTGDEVVITGHLSDEELVMLYNLCKLFIFPSLYEGLGLPILEAMACGAPVIAANNSSIPEVMGREDAMFDAMSETSIMEALHRTLTDDEFRLELAAYGLKRVKLFSWEKSAKKAWNAIDTTQKDKNNHTKPRFIISNKKPRIAYLSPLPPQKSGIANYSADLLPYLNKYFDIDIFVDANHKISDYKLPAKYDIIASTELLDRREDYITAVYQMGNSEYHAHMIRLMKEFPGVVVLHEFFLSHLIYHLCSTSHVDFEKTDFISELSKDHSMRSMIDLSQNGFTNALWNWPLNWQVLKHAQEIVVHSAYQNELLHQYFGNGWTPKLNLIKQVRLPIDHKNDQRNNVSREKLGIGQDEFLFCSFGFINSIKLSHLIIQAFNNTFVNDDKVVLIFVGELDEGDYGRELLKVIGELSLRNRIKITGFVNDKTYKHYLNATDVAIQLRINSRGETSRAVLDTLANGIPTIVNSHGSLNDYSSEIVAKIPEIPDVVDLSQAMISLFTDQGLRKKIGSSAYEEILEKHNPEQIALDYTEIIHRAAESSESRLFLPLVESMIRYNIPEDGIKATANFAALNLNLRCQPRILIDVSNISYVDLRTGIQRVVKSIIRELFSNSEPSIFIELVKIIDGNLFRSLRFSERLFNLPTDSLGQETPIEILPGDILFMLDTSWNLYDQFLPLFQQIRMQGGKIMSMVYDLIPVRYPEFCVENVLKYFKEWLYRVVTENDLVVCISRAVKEDLGLYIQEERIPIDHKLEITYFHLGADIEVSQIESNVRTEVIKIINDSTTPLFLMVGTIEPRKSHVFILNVFEALWSEGNNYRLCFAGQIGWNMEIIHKRLLNHPELGKRLFFVDNPSDAELDILYKSTTALIMASITEGFGLPIVEAAAKNVLVIINDIPVFHEIAGEMVPYFSLESPKSIIEAIHKTVELTKEERLNLVKSINVLTWKESTKWLLSIIYGQPPKPPV